MSYGSTLFFVIFSTYSSCSAYLPPRHLVTYFYIKAGSLSPVRSFYKNDVDVSTQCLTIFPIYANQIPFRQAHKILITLYENASSWPKAQRRL